MGPSSIGTYGAGADSVGGAGWLLRFRPLRIGAGAGLRCLKNRLTNCVRHGAESQNREDHPAFRLHLDGRVGFVEMVNAAKGARLRKIFERIQW
jgi:hypothetical protein